MKLKKIAVPALVSIVIIAVTVVYLKSKSPVIQVESEDEAVPVSEPHPPAPPVAASESAVVSGTPENQPAAQVQKAGPIDRYIEKLKSAGYTQDPENPLRYIKKTIDKNGKEKKSYVDVDPNQPEVKQIDENYANELLARQQNEDPSAEMAAMSEMDDSYGQSTMLSGKFRDESADVDISITTAYDDDMKSKLGFPVCIVAKKAKLDFISMGYPVKTNEEGYGLVDFKNGYFLRAMSIFDNKDRLLVGQILLKQNGQFQVVQKIRARAIKSIDGEKLKYCDGRKYGSN